MQETDWEYNLIIGNKHSPSQLDNVIIEPLLNSPRTFLNAFHTKIDKIYRQNKQEMSCCEWLFGAEYSES